MEGITLQVITDRLRSEFGYYFNQDTQLRNSETDEEFKFVDQKHYENLGDLIQLYIEQSMKEIYNLQEVWLPLGNQTPKCNIFHSQDWFSNVTRALILIQGAGAVRAGNWARSVCINHSLNAGTVFPFLTQGFQEGYSAIVLNPNFTYCQSTRQPIPILNNSFHHCQYVWENFIRNCPAQELYIVAHSAGGPCTVNLLKKYEQEFITRVKAIAFTDSVHGPLTGMSPAARNFVRNNAVDWIGSDRERDTIISRDFNGCVNVSSGHRKHEYTTGFAFPSIFPFFQQIRNGVNPYLGH